MVYCNVFAPETTHTPQGDGNSSTVRYGMQKRSETTTPRKGTETPDSPWRRQRPDGNNPHPARGRKHMGGPWHPSPPWKQPTPRKGTETNTRKTYNSPQKKQPTPRKGTETLRLCRIRRAAPLETTHTPQGDGNRLAPRLCSQPGRNNPHPARGRKHLTRSK